MKTKTLAVLAQPTADQIKQVIGELDTRWSRTTLKALDRAEQAIDAGDGLQAKYWGTFAGIGTDKILPIRGLPTTIVSNIHEYRADISVVIDKLAIAARVLGAHESKGYVTRALPAPRSPKGLP